MTFKFFDKLSQNFIELLDDNDDYNVILIAKNEKSFIAHSSVLKCRSPYFRKELKNIIPNENNIRTITKSNISDGIFDIILKYIYGGIVDLENVETKFIFDLMVTDNEFEIEELTKKLENHLIETESSWLKSHFSLVYRSIFSRNEFKDLEKFCNDIVAKYPSLIFDADDFTSLQESALVSLLKRDDLQLEEVIIWEYVIKWGIAQNSTLPVDFNEWTKENFITLKTTLQQCLPLIRYFHISNADFWSKVEPYKKIFDKQLWKDLNQHLIVPDQPVKSKILPPRSVLIQELPTRIAESLSTIITYEHVAEISSWIDRKSSTYSLTNVPYEFQLILRGSINGFTPQTRNEFKDLEKFCNDIVAKYPSLIFDADDFTSLQESALVSLLKRDDLQLEEVIIWEYVIKWGIAQNSTLPVDFNEWTKENFITLKTTLQQCLPLIRYFHISNADFWSKVEPYKKIFDKQLWKDLNQHLIVPDQPVKSKILPPRSVLIQELPTRIAESLSTIITYEHVAEISSWIDRKSSTYSLTNVPYEFQLILRGSINGFTPQTFWDTCHDHASTVVIMKVKRTEEILGGYNPLAWDANTGGSWAKTNDSFIFSLKNDNLQNSILSRVKIRDNAILNVKKDNQVYCGPYFGYNLCMHSPSSNFTLDKNSMCNNNFGHDHYEKPIRTTAGNFSIVDYEVFKVMKKLVGNFDLK
ncbi:hypothetical protein Glove_196g138 [Diversispora epigaea]|uniref:BTB domain-containing protein n=1 Tax=Diversispora epigaea TaxID=1348612 RepID=A0A397IV65_9GLOM|nr:hypothetical protein Glove_196g138 [Diversispora epigaea]